MIDIGGWMMDTFGPYGAIGIALVIFLIFYIDAVFFPTLPEIFFIIGFMYDASGNYNGALFLLFGGMIVVMICSTLAYARAKTLSK